MGKLFGFLFLLFLAIPACAQTTHKEIIETQTRQEIIEIQKQKIALLQGQKRLLDEAAAFEKTLHNLSLVYTGKKKHLTKQQGEISTKLLLLAHLGRANPLRLLVDPTTGQNTLRGVILIRVFTASLKRQMQKAQAELNEIKALTKDLEAKSKSHLQLLQDIELKQNQLANLKSQKIADWKKIELGRLAEDDDINSLLGETRETLSKTGRSAIAAAKAQNLPFYQLERPVAGKIIKDASLQNKFSPQSQGIIFEARKNAEVLAPFEGKVVFKGPFQTQGDILILDHGKKVQTVLMGMHKIDAYVGQRVYAGEKLGTMAGYGASSPKLYLELRQKGKAIDPQPYFTN